MDESKYKIKVKMGWEFIVTADNEDEAINKLGPYLDSLFTKDGYSVHSFNAKENVKKSEYSIEFYDGFIVD